MKIINKVLKKIQDEGFGKLILATKDFLFRKARRTGFKLNAFIKFKLINTHHAYEFKAMPVTFSTGYKFAISNPEFLKNVQQRKFQILSDKEDSYLGADGKISWNLDPVHNRIWPMSKWGVDISIGYNQGDIKRPWELGRLHVLVELALRYKNESHNPIKLALCKNAEDILKDFSESNSYFYGPQWICAMDVGIRIANICMAVDIFGEEFQRSNQQLLNYELARHLFFIENNLEFKNRRIVNNHFLGNLAGLVSLLVHTEQHPNIKRKLTKYSSELVNQLDIQFLEDGGNFEGSTYYHRLSCELTLFPLTAILSSNPQTLTKNHLEIVKNKFNKIYNFTSAIQDFEQKVPQIGDNDSGHLYIFDSHSFETKDNNFSNLSAALEVFIKNINSKDIHDKILNAYLSNLIAANENQLAETLLSVQAKEVKDFSTEFSNKKNKQSYVFTFKDINLDLLEVLHLSKFGLIIYKSNEFFLAIRSGQSILDVVGGHRHIDQLSFNLKTRDVLTPRDPGSYCYTSDSNLRNIFRSAEVHHVPCVEGDCSLSGMDLFEMNKYDGECLYVSQNQFWGKFTGNIDTYYRAITISKNQLEVIDWSENDLNLKRLSFQENYFSPRYGVWSEDR